MSLRLGTMKECREFIKGFISIKADRKGHFSVNQHEVANTYGLNSGHISVCLKDLINDGKIRKVKPHGYRKPAVYQVVVALV